jgi:hypothetical protein
MAVFWLLVSLACVGSHAQDAAQVVKTGAQ